MQSQKPATWSRVKIGHFRQPMERNSLIPVVDSVLSNKCILCGACLKARLIIYRAEGYSAQDHITTVLSLLYNYNMMDVENAVSVSNAECACLFQKLCQLEEQILEYKDLNDSLVRKLDEELFHREIAQVESNQSKEALLEKSRELQELNQQIEAQNQTIDTQNALLGYAWANAQEQQGMIRNLNKDMEEIMSLNAYDDSSININKKRRRLS